MSGALRPAASAAKFTPQAVRQHRLEILVVVRATGTSLRARPQMLEPAAGGARAPTVDSWRLQGDPATTRSGSPDASSERWRGRLGSSPLTKRRLPCHGSCERPEEGLVGELVHEVPMSGSIPYAVGQASVVRIPIPGSDGLCIEFRPRFPGDWRPRDGTTSTLFFQDIEGKRQLRLDYGERRLTPTTTTIDYHWNQEGTHRQFGITSHTPVGMWEPRLWRVAYSTGRRGPSLRPCRRSTRHDD